MWAIVTDNNRINQNLFTLLAPDGSYKFQNPKSTERVIRLIYDSIHVFKNFRNNWINLKDLDKSFFYPKFDDHSIIQMATFADIRELYHSEKFKIIKAAPKLSLRTIYPSTFDRQRVPLALNIVHPTTCAALRANECDETAEFLEIIKTWFTIMNNRPKKNDVENSDCWRDPITSTDCFQVVFLKKFVEWMKRWKDLAPLLHTGGLSIDTFKAAISCTEGMISLLDDAFKTCNIQEFFPGYVQTNDLEKRFGVYRQSSGCNYGVTIKQIMETEKKLRIKTLIKQFPDEIRATRYTKKEYKIVDYTAYLDLLDSDYIAKFEDYDHGSFMYICGYVCHNAVNRLDCSLCKDLIVKYVGGSSSNDYFDYLQRGELIVPTDNCLLILIHMSAILNAIRNDKEIRRKFQFSDDPSSILVLLTVEGIERNASFVVDWNDTCSCSVLYKDLFLPLMRTIANILLNNYRKKINDANLVRKMNESKEKKRKREEKKEGVKEQEYEKCSEPKNRKCMVYEKIK